MASLLEKVLGYQVLFSHNYSLVASSHGEAVPLIGLSLRDYTLLSGCALLRSNLIGLFSRGRSRISSHVLLTNS